MSKTLKKVVMTEAEFFLHAYELYKKDWCATRGYSYAEVCQAERDDMEFNGEMFACPSEFECEEFLDSEYMQSILTKREFLRYARILLCDRRQGLSSIYQRAGQSSEGI